MSDLGRANCTLLIYSAYVPPNLSRLRAVYNAILVQHKTTSKIWVKTCIMSGFHFQEAHFSELRLTAFLRKKVKFITQGFHLIFKHGYMAETVFLCWYAVDRNFSCLILPYKQVIMVAKFLYICSHSYNEGSSLPLGRMYPLTILVTANLIHVKGNS